MSWFISYKPPSSTYRSVHDWVEDHRALMAVEKAGDAVAPPRAQPVLRAGVSTVYTAGPVETLMEVPLRVSNGWAKAVLDGFVVGATDRYPTIMADKIGLSRGRWFYEVKVEASGKAAIGWADKQYVGDWTVDEGVGDDVSSWAFVGGAGGGEVRHDGSSRVFGQGWKKGDVVGVCVDLDALTMSFGLNGAWEEPFGECCVCVCAKC